jgi:hypothetical protein
MAYDAGGIKYEIEVGTADLMRATAATDKAMSNQTASMNQADKKVKQLEKSQQQLGGTVAATGAKINATAQGVKKGMNNMSGAMTNVSYQLQDIAVQAQMGINPFMIASQQLPQLLVGMGAAAAGIGAAIAVVGGLAMAYIDTSTSAEKLEKAINNIKAAITLSKDGVIGYTEEMERLGRVSENVAKFKLQALAVEAKSAMKDGVDAIADVFSELDDGDILTNFNDAVKFSDQLTKSFAGRVGSYASYIGEQLGYTGEEARQLGAEFIRTVKALSTAETTKEVDELQNKLVDMANATGKSSTEIQKLLAQTFPLIENMRNSAAAIEASKVEYDELAESTRKVGDAFASELTQLTLQNVLLEEGERAAYEMSLQLQGFSEAQRESALAVYDKNKALEQQQEEYKTLSEEIDAYAEMARQFEEEEKRRQEAEANKEASKKIQAEGFAQGVVDRGMSEDERFAAELDKLTELRERGLISQQLYDEAIVASVTQRTEAVAEQEAKQEALARSQKAMLLGSTSDMFMGIAEIMRNSKGEQSKEYKAMFKIAKGFAVAQAALNFATALSNASAVSPWPAKFAALAEAAASGGALLAAVNGAQYSGARQYGGPVSNGKPYLVGERGPEMFVPNGNGQIMTNKDLMGGSQQQASNTSITFNVAGDMSEQVKNEILNNQDLIYSAVAAAKSENGEMF